MFRHLPILLTIFLATSAHAEQGFFEQVLDSLKSKTATTPGDAAGELTDSTANESEPLALQPTATTRRHYKKRYHTNRRHPERAPPSEPRARAELPAGSRTKDGQSSGPESAVAPELINNSAPLNSVVPSENESNVLPPPTVWPKPAPAPLAPWPDESSPLESAQGDSPRDAQAEIQPEAEIDAATDATEVAQKVDPESFLDSQRAVLAGFSATWLALGIGMFVFRRRLARTLDARRRREVHDAETPDTSRALRVILSSAGREGTVVETGGPAESRVVAAG
jgi:hypothetical protein